MNICSLAEVRLRLDFAVAGPPAPGTNAADLFDRYEEIASWRLAAAAC
jgi:hypothetical protein